jgi:Aerotolerance regulator N-terminal
MSFLAPLWLGVAALVGAGVVVAHLFSTTVPPRDLLPTVRFVPEGAPLTVLRSRRISDVLLLVLRLLAVAALGLALAGAHFARSAPARIVVADVSRAVASAAELRDSVARWPGILVGADSLVPVRARGSLSAGLVAAHRALLGTTAGRERAELVIVSPIVREEVDSATATLLALWEGPVRFVRVRAASAPPPVGLKILAVGDDPVAAALATSFQNWNKAAPAVRLVRATPTSGDSLWARDSGGVLVLWPAAFTATADSQGGIATERATVIGPAPRQRSPAPGRVLVRWLDGKPAATERALGSGCLRDVAIPVDPVGDLPLRESFRNLASSLLEPCGGAADFTPVAIARATAPRRAAETRADAGALPLWLALFAALVLLAEQRLRA